LLDHSKDEQHACDCDSWLPFHISVFPFDCILVSPEADSYHPAPMANARGKDAPSYHALQAVGFGVFTLKLRWFDLGAF
jgi:hypothetical protein